MSDFNNLFKDFSKASSEEWLAKITADLKGKSITELDWEVEDGLRISPFANGALSEAIPVVDKQITNDNNWSIFEEIEVTDAKLANQKAVKALMGGVEGLWLKLNRIAPDELAVLFEGIHLDYISIHFTGEAFAENPIDYLDAFIAFAKSKSVETTQLRGSIAMIFSESEKQKEVEQFCKKHLPEFVAKTIASNFKNDNLTSNELAELLSSGSDYLASSKSHDSDSQIQFLMGVGSSYFLNIAKLRAFKLLWANVLQAYHRPFLNPPEIHVNVLLFNAGEDENTQVIYATTQAMSAVFGGVTSIRITLQVKESKRDFAQHILRNLQNLFKLESYLDRVIDPAEGSYYIEQMTAQLADKAWLIFQKLENKKSLP